MITGRILLRNTEGSLNAISFSLRPHS